MEGQHSIMADEPLGFDIGDPPASRGQSRGWTPVHYQLGAMAMCTSITITVVANDQGFAYRDLRTRVRSLIDIRGFFFDLHLQPQYEQVTFDLDARHGRVGREAVRRWPTSRTVAARSSGLFHLARIPMLVRWFRAGVRGAGGTCSGSSSRARRPRIDCGPRPRRPPRRRGRERRRDPSRSRRSAGCAGSRRRRRPRGRRRPAWRGCGGGRGARRSRCARRDPRASSSRRMRSSRSSTASRATSAAPIPAATRFCSVVLSSERKPIAGSMPRGAGGCSTLLDRATQVAAISGSSSRSRDRRRPPPRERAVAGTTRT